MTTPAIEDLLRELTPQVLGTLIRRHGQFEDCEDAVQEAVLAAAVQWPAEGVPDNPRGWLLTVASRRLIDQVRSEHARRERESALAAESVTSPRGGDRGRAGHRRHAGAAVPVLPSRADPGLADRADAARGRRPDHGRDRPRVPGTRGHHGGQDQPGQAEHQVRGQHVHRAGGGRAPGTAPGRPARALPDIQRGLHCLIRRRAAARRPRARGDPPGQDGARATAHGRRGERAARANAAHPGQAAGTRDRGRRAGAAGRAGPRPVGPGPDRGGHGPGQGVAAQARHWGRTRCRQPSPQRTPTRPRRRRPTGHRCTPCT